MLVSVITFYTCFPTFYSLKNIENFNLFCLFLKLPTPKNKPDINTNN